MAKFCPKCGAGLADTAKFCPACGAQSPGAAPQQAPQPPVQPQYQQPVQQPQYQQPQYQQPQYQQPYAPAPVPPTPPAKKKSKAPLVIIAVIIIGGLVAAGIFTNGFGLFGGKGVVSVSGITGGNAIWAQSGKGEQAVKEGAKLKAGSRLVTGAGTCVYLKIDKDSVIKMDENSEISLSEISGKLLKLDLTKGSVLINENGKEGRLQMTAGNTLLIVRGTFFTAKYESDSMVVDLIEGEIDVTTDSGSVTDVEQGQRVTVSGDSEAAVEALDVSRFDAFTINSVMEYKAVLADASLTEQDFSYISDRLDSLNGGNSDVGVSDSGNSEMGVGDGGGAILS